MIIDSSYFKADIHIAGLSSTGVQDSVSMFIDKYEPEYLIKILGYDFYKSFTDAIAEEAPDDKWTKLLTGDTYTDAQGITQKWYGFQQDVSATQVNISPIACYVYFYYSRKTSTVTTASGETGVRWEKSVSISPAQKQAKAWNDMVELNKRLYDFLLCKKVDGSLVYSEFDTSKIGCDAEELFIKINPMI